MRASLAIRYTAIASGSSLKVSQWNLPGSRRRASVWWRCCVPARLESLIQGLHQSVFRAEKRIGLMLFGKGNIGSRWLELFAREQSTLSARTGFEFVLAGVVDSRRSLLNYEGLDASRALAFFDDEAVEQDEESLFLWMRAHPYDDLVVLDVTASEQLADQYLDFASHGFHVISANKLAGASASDKYRQIHDAFEKTGRYWLYNATWARDCRSTTRCGI
ncbi:bifunctional aspartokinase II/homoserine dehydrogenase II [Salmonella enterica subsp. enterica]|nr:bifunctional aspartokinase II/homoserine dehydrogenase II [Salmonella enterica subsp. enterica]